MALCSGSEFYACDNSKDLEKEGVNYYHINHMPDIDETQECLMVHPLLLFFAFS